MVRSGPVLRLCVRCLLHQRRAPVGATRVRGWPSPPPHGRRCALAGPPRRFSSELAIPPLVRRRLTLRVPVLTAPRPRSISERPSSGKSPPVALPRRPAVIAPNRRAGTSTSRLPQRGARRRSSSSSPLSRRRKRPDPTPAEDHLPARCPTLRKLYASARSAATTPTTQQHARCRPPRTGRCRSRGAPSARSAATAATAPASRGGMSSRIRSFGRVHSGARRLRPPPPWRSPSTSRP